MAEACQEKSLMTGRPFQILRKLQTLMWLALRRSSSALFQKHAAVRDLARIDARCLRSRESGLRALPLADVDLQHGQCDPGRRILHVQVDRDLGFAQAFRRAAQGAERSRGQQVRLRLSWVGRTSRKAFSRPRDRLD